MDQRWKQLGRQVKLGEKGIKILVPHVQKRTDEETGEGEFMVRSFGLGTVFDIAQTEGKPLPERPHRELQQSLSGRVPQCALVHEFGGCPVTD